MLSLTGGRNVEGEPIEKCVNDQLVEEESERVFYDSLGSAGRKQATITNTLKTHCRVIK